MEDFIGEELSKSCLIFPFSKINANAISALVASLDTHPILKELDILFPKLLDDPQLIIESVKRYTKIILAYSLFSTQLDLVSQKIKEYRSILIGKELLIIAGGPHPMGDPFSMLVNGADIVCTTEGELAIRDILLKFIGGKNVNETLGIAYLDAQSKLIRTNKPEMINLDDFPPFSHKHRIIRPIEITRGCAWNCRFCQIRSRGLPVRHRSVEQVLKYIKITVDYFYKRRPDIRFISPNALSYGSRDGKNLQLDVVEAFLRGIKQIIGKEGKIYFGSFPSEVRPETITKESVSILKKYTNVEKIIVGGQSGSDSVLEYSERGHTVQETERAVKLLVDNGFNVDVDIIFGLPGETDDDVKQTLTHINYLTNIGATIHSHTFLPLVGTPFASKPGGKISPLYLPIINNLQDAQKLSGFHVKQEREAKIMAMRRKHEKELKRVKD
ncbi:MAG: TIGR04013 family B12-binding domain/radical SAM domain-containing protein [Candidatus Heimdallarchaeota archaeon]|nr:TIGR04013 family B12-binding domain/radical SAM domain-containing protein [Candidatus Heimdallarchaeota archaeon]